MCTLVWVYAHVYAWVPVGARKRCIKLSVVVAAGS